MPLFHGKTVLCQKNITICTSNAYISETLRELKKYFIKPIALLHNSKCDYIQVLVAAVAVLVIMP